jgi:hypothetical protein
MLLMTIALAAAPWPAYSDPSPPPPAGMAAVDPPVPMPAFSLPGLNGAPADSSALRDKVVVVRFWATW